MSIVEDILKIYGARTKDRQPWEEMWFDSATYALPDAERFDRFFAEGNISQLTNSVVKEPIASERSKAIYDQTSLWAIERGTAGFMSLITPQSEKWHGYDDTDPLVPRLSDEEQVWAEKLRDYVHKARANPQSGYWIAWKSCMRGVWGFGTSVMFVDEVLGGGTTLPTVYRYVPLGECHLATSFAGLVNSNMRVFTRSAIQCVTKFPGKCSEKTKELAADPAKQDFPVQLIHFVDPRQERGGRANTNRNSPFASYVVEIENKHMILEGGYWHFPFPTFHWNRMGAQPYSEGPISLALADVKSLNALSKDTLRASQLTVNPPWATHGKQIGRLRLNSQNVNPGLINQRGDMLARPMFEGVRPDFAQTVLEFKREAIKESLYINLWQILIQNPKMTATEAMIRAEEKGQLIGPAATSVYAGLSAMGDAELILLDRKGAFDPGSPLEPPTSIAERSLGMHMTTPLDRLQRMSEVVGLQRLIEFMTALAAATGDQGIWERFNIDEAIDIAQEVLGAPKRVMRSVDDAKPGRDQAAQMQSLMATLEATRQGGEAVSAAAQGSADVAASPLPQQAQALLPAPDQAQPAPVAA